MRYSRRSIGLLTALLLAGASQAAIAETVLTIKADAAQVDLERSDLEALEITEIETGTDWTNGIGHFTGPLVRDVISLAKLDGVSFVTVTATAANDYSVEIPASDFQEYDVILAMTMDGERLTLRDKGPLWIVYPRDDHPELKDPLINSRWIWQLVSLELK